MSNTKKSSGISFAGLLTIVFITLKLCNVIAWSWWWVLAPIWVPISMVLGLTVLFGLILFLIRITVLSIKPAKRSSLPGGGRHLK